MGMYYRASIMVGLPLSEFEHTSEFYKLLEDGDLDECPTYYDGGGNDQNIIGFKTQETDDYSNCELKMDYVEIEQLSLKFFELTGKVAKVYLSTRGN